LSSRTGEPEAKKGRRPLSQGENAEKKKGKRGDVISENPMEKGPDGDVTKAQKKRTGEKNGPF